ncbi:NADPH-dependent FMN reductase [Pseudonocardia acaciae]|uniref:NADPH-dependent FMN reductase n=1 Tax=Pseudonocardia acaciae TaxID=551276 RepID=UPI00048B5B63|nr:NADPH-dependent FMN reductase [Pseudonocardia acaciae]
MRLLGLSGSLRVGSHNRKLLEVAASTLPDGVVMDVYSGLGDIPPYLEDGDAPEPVLALREAIGAADAVLIATPEYNGSIPGVLKNALDWASRPFPNNALRAKPVAVIGASTGVFGAVWAQAELRKVLGLIGADVIDTELPVALADDAFTEDGSLADPGLTEALADLVGQLVRAAGEVVGTPR